MKKIILLSFTDSGLKHKAGGRIETDGKEFLFYPDPSFRNMNWLNVQEVKKNMHELKAVLISESQFYNLKECIAEFLRLINKEQQVRRNNNLPQKINPYLMQIIKLKKKHLFDWEIGELLCKSRSAIEKMLGRERKRLNLRTTDELIEYYELRNSGE